MPGGPAMTTDSLTEQAFHLHPLSVPYRVIKQGLGIVFLLLFLSGPVFGAVASVLGIPLAIALGLAVVVAIVGYGIAYYRRFEYELTPDTFDIRSGVFARRDREIPLHRIQNVDISRNVIQRALGLAEVRLETAGASGAEAQLKYVGGDRASQLQREISRLRRSADDQRAGEEQFETVFQITERELGLLALVSADAQLMPILFLAASVFVPAVGSLSGSEWVFFGTEALSGMFGPLVTLGGLIAIGLAYGVINAAMYYGFTLDRAPEELRYERGLLQKYSGTIPLSKIQSLTIRENVLERALGYASLEIETAGQGGGERDQGTTQSAIPLAERHRVFELTNSIEAVGDMRFERPPKRARQRYAVRYAAVVGAVTGLLYFVQGVFGRPLYWWAPLGLLVVVPLAAHLKWKHRGYFAGENHIVTRNGFWVRQLKVVPYYRVQTVLSSETIFQRRRHLGTVTIDTAGARSLIGTDARAADIARETTEQLREQVAEELYESLRRRSDSGTPERGDGAGRDAALTGTEL
ncbi:MAG: PH domain-containing protein [Halolamina sp.]